MKLAVPRENYAKIVEAILGKTKTETVQLFSFPGWDELVKGITPVAPEESLASSVDEMNARLNEAIAARSPLTPEDAFKRSILFMSGVNAAYTGLIAAVVAAELSGFGQLETPALMIPHAPAVRAVCDAASAVTRAALDASIVRGVTYYALSQHTPEILPEDVLVDARCKGFIDEASYIRNMRYHGYDEAKARLYARTGVRMPDISALILMSRRGLIDESRFMEWGAYHRIPSDALSLIYRLREERPEPYRIADFAAKGVITIDSAVESFKWHGMSEYWARAWVESQYAGVPLSTVLELRRRGLIDDATARVMLSRAGYKGEWHDKLLALTRELCSLSVVAELAVRGLMDYGRAESYAAMLGYGRDEFSMVYSAGLRWPTLDMIFEMLWRGLIDEDKARELVKRLGYSDDLCDALFGLRERIPSTSDLVTMVVREAFVPEMVTPAPEIFAKYMEKMGWSREWADRYWTAHWRPIPLELAYDNVRRGLRDVEWFKNVLKIHDLHPMWWDDIVNVMYNPPSLRELGYGYDVGVYSKEDIKRYRMWGGLSPEDAEKAAEAMVAYRTEAEREALRREYMYLYAIDKISRDEFESRLIALGTNPEAVKLWLERGDLYRVRIRSEVPRDETRTISRSDALYLYERGLRDRFWLVGVLKRLGYSDEDVADVLAIADARREERLKPPEEPQPRRLTLSQIEDALRIGLISESEALKRIMDMGYSAEDADTLLKVMLYTPSGEARVREFTRGDIGALYRYNLFSFNDVLRSYKALGYDDYHAELLAVVEVLDYWYPKLYRLYRGNAIPIEDVVERLIDAGLTPVQAQRVAESMKFELSYERLAEERKLTKSEIIKGVKNGVFTFDQGVSLLMDLGYERGEAEYILFINGIVAAGDPAGYYEMRRAVEMMKKAQGKPYVEIPDEVVAQERMIEEQRRKIEEMRRKGVSEEEVASEVGVLAEMEAMLRRLVKRYHLENI